MRDTIIKRLKEYAADVILYNVTSGTTFSKHITGLDTHLESKLFKQARRLYETSDCKVVAVQNIECYIEEYSIPKSVFKQVCIEYKNRKGTTTKWKNYNINQ